MKADAAFRDLILGAIPSLRAFAISLTNDPVRADDLVQDTILRAWSNAERFESGTEPADQRLAREEEQEAVRAAIDQLPDHSRTILLLRDIEGVSTQEVAEQLGISPNAVKLRLHRARQALRTLLAPRLGRN